MSTRERSIQDTSSIPTWKTDKQKLFRVWQQMGRIPSRYKSWDELGKEFLLLISRDKLTPKQARAKMGVTYTNVIGNNILAKTTSSKGEVRGINVRAITEDINAVEELMLRDVYSDKWFEDFRGYVKNNWTTVAKNDILKIEKYLKPWGNKTKRGTFHRGHGHSAAENPSTLEIGNVGPQLGRENSRQGSAPRYPREILQNLNIPESTTQAWYNRLLTMEGLDINPYKILELRLNPEHAGYSPDQIEFLEQRAFQLKQQGVPDSKIRQYFADKSWLLDATTATAQSGPVRTKFVDPQPYSKPTPGKIPKLGAATSNVVSVSPRGRIRATTGNVATEIAPYVVDPDVGIRLGQGDFGGAAQKVAQNIGDDLEYMAQNPYETVRNVRNMAAAAAVFPLGTGIYGTAQMVRGGIRFVEGIVAGNQGFDTVDDYRQYNAEQREIESKQLSDTLLRMQEEKEANR